MRFTPFINYYLIYYSFTEQHHFSWTYSNYFIYASMVLIKEPSMPATLVLNTLPYGFVVLNSDHHNKSWDSIYSKWIVIIAGYYHYK